MPRYDDEMKIVALFACYGIKQAVQQEAPDDL